MISVTQPRRPADDFLASLQANLQGNARSTRRRGQQHQSVADESNKKKAVAKEQKRPRPPPQQKPNMVKSDNIIKGRNADSRKTESNKSVKPPTKPSVSRKVHKRTAISSSDNEPMISRYDDDPPERDVYVVPEIVPPLVEQPPVLPQQPPQFVEVVQASPTSYQHGPQNPPPHQQGPRQSKNNFYFKNQSNIFNTGWNSYGNTTSSSRVNNPVAADNVVVEKALRIASQQPLPPPPTFSTHYEARYQGEPVQEIVSPNRNVIQTSQGHVPSLVAPSPVSGRVTKLLPLHSHYTQSFSITGGVDQDSKTQQELERRKWIQGLEAQITEKKEREKQEKLRQRSPYPVPPQPTYSATPTYSTYPTSQQPIAPPPNTFPQSNTHQLPQYQQSTQNANLSNVHPSQNILLSPQTVVQQQPRQSPTLDHKLGQHAYVDPVEQERRQDARRRALENQEIIRKQVEERERLKREEQERIKREEDLEIWRIEEVKRRMAEEVRMEQDKVRKKEEAQLEHMAEMRRKIEEANKSALDLKVGKRRRTPNTPKVVETQYYAEEVIEKKQSSEVVTNKPVRTLQKESRASLVEVDGVGEQLTITRQVQPTVRYMSNAATQTVREVSCQTVDRQDSFLPTETKLIQLQERELSVVQRQQTVPNNRIAQSKQRSVNKPPIKKEKTRQVPEIPKVQYDNNGRRIRPKVQPEPPTEVTPFPAPSNIIAEESVAVTEYTSIADIFDDPKPESPIMEVESVGPSPFSIPDQQIQMRYISPQNEERIIPSAISARQNDILNQLEKLRMGLKDRRRHMSSVDNDQ